MMSTVTTSPSLTPARSSSSFRSRTARLFPQRFTLAIMDIHSVDTQERIRITDWVMILLGIRAELGRDLAGSLNNGLLQEREFRRGAQAPR